MVSHNQSEFNVFVVFLQQLPVEEDVVLGGQFPCVQLPARTHCEVLGQELACWLVVGTIDVPCQQSQLLVEVCHQLRTKIPWFLLFVLSIAPFVLCHGFGLAVQHRDVGHQFSDGNLITLLDVFLHELLNYIVEVVIPICREPPPCDPE